MAVLDNSTVRGIGLSILMGLLGFGAKQAVESYGQTTTLTQHTAQISKLFDIAQQNQKALETNAVSTARIEVKIDVINQKIDDDRSKTRR